MLATRFLTVLTRQTFKQTTRTFCLAVDPRRFKMPSVAETIDGKIKAKKVMMFSKTYCPFCTKAKKVFEILTNDGTLSTEDFEIMEIENDPNCDAMQAHLGKLTGAKSVPRVFVNGKSIGGGDDVVALHKNGQLAAMIKG